MSLHGELVRLRTIERDDVETLAGWTRAYDTWPETDEKPYRPRPVADAVHAFDDGGESSYRARDSFVPFAVAVGNDLVGSVSLWGIDAHNRHAHLGITLGTPFRGLGYGTDACRILLRYAFVDLGLHRVQLEVLASNAGAIRAYEKAGFVVEGRLRESGWVRGGFEDEIIMSVLAPRAEV